MELTFYDSLSRNQKLFADKIADRARAMGIPPELAVSIAFKESGLNPGVQPGSFGEIGIMQIKPGTAKEMGFSPDDIKDPEKNIEAGLKYLKKSLDMSEGNPRLAAAGYNAGVNHKFFSSEDATLPDITVKYLRDLRSYGAFTPTVTQKTAPDQAVGEKTPEQVSEEAAVGMGQMAGLGVGSAETARRLLGSTVGGAARFLGRSAQEGKLAADAGAAAPPRPPVGGQMAAGLADDATQLNRILQGTTDVETGTTGRARMGGFNIETAQQAARAKQAAQTVGALQKAGMVAQGAPDILAQAPGMTATPSGVLYPRTPAGPSAPPPTPSRGALEEVKKLFTKMMGPTTSAAGTALRYAAPPLAGMQAGSEIASMVQESGKEQPDYTKMGLSGLGALGAVMSMFPGTAPVGIPLAIGAPMIQAGRENRGPLSQIGELQAP